jgi:vacuolar-type H+-ATPase subunit H
MKLNKITLLILVVLMAIGFSSCNQLADEPKNIKPEISHMKSITELAAMEVYYHNVAKYKEEDAEGILLWKKDKHFWIEYSGIVKIGIDTSLLNINVEENEVVISIPEAKVLDVKVDEDSLTEDSFLVAKKSADVSGEDEIKAFGEAQNNMIKSASKDSALLANAQQRAQKLLEEYVKNVGNAIGKEYSIQWEYVEDNDQLIDDISDDE